MRGSAIAAVVAAALAHWAVPAAAAPEGPPPLQRPRAMAASRSADPPTIEPVADAPADGLSLDGSDAPTDTTNAGVTTQRKPPARDATSTHAERRAPPVRPPRPRAPASAKHPNEAAVRQQANPKRDKFPHRGFTMDLRLGTQGCVRKVCSGDRHATKPGFRIDGFVGANIRGWVDLGVAGGWGTLRAEVKDGTNALALYGIDAATLQATAEALGNPLDVNLNSLAVQDAKLRTARVGPLVRVHFIPRGRVAAWVGTGVGYDMFRARYKTRGGDVRFTLHGLDVPIEAGLAVFVHRNVAVVAEFDYLWTWYGLGSLKHPTTDVTIPLKVLESAASDNDVDLRRELPQLWTVGFGVRARF